MNCNVKLKYFSIILCIICPSILLAQVKLPKLISDGMVLQRDTELKIWGWAAKGEEVTVKFLDADYNTVADENGTWSIELPKQNAGGPYTMIIKGNNEITIDDIMIGEVWVCSGQSNMEITMQRVSQLYPDEIANCTNPSIRYFEVPDRFNFTAPKKDFDGGSWIKPDPKSILRFSAICYFFGKEIYEKYNVPVGLINSALGGSPIQCWISEENLKEFPKDYEEAIKYKDSLFVQQIRDKDQNRMNGWYKRQAENDIAYTDNLADRWKSQKCSTEDWKTLTVPGFLPKENGKNVNGVYWFRKEFEVSADLSGKEAKLNLGTLIDADSTFVNGIFVGNITYQYPPRRYKIPAGVLKEGKNVVVVRLVSNIGHSGFVPEKKYEVVVDDKVIYLSGEWNYKIGIKMEPLLPQTFIRWKPVGLYNQMIAPLFNYKIKGAIWYQGEANAEHPNDYSKLLKILIKNWRQEWGIGDFPFITVQLPNFMEEKPEPSESNWALIREAQLQSLSLPNTGLTVAIDLGEWNDIHPLNKKDVSYRIFLNAEKLAYGNDDICYSGPIYKSMFIEESKAVICFTNICDGLMVKGDKLGGFAIAASDGKFVWANAKIENDKVVVWSDKIANPVTVRYAWADNPTKANLYNKSGLPASPFRTDKD